MYPAIEMQARPKYTKYRFCSSSAQLPLTPTHNPGTASFSVRYEPATVTFHQQGCWRRGETSRTRGWWSYILRSLQSRVLTIHRVVLTADVLQLFIKSTRNCKKGPISTHIGHTQQRKTSTTTAAKQQQTPRSTAQGHL